MNYQRGFLASFFLTNEGVAGVVGEPPSSNHSLFLLLVFPGDASHVSPNIAGIEILSQHIQLHLHLYTQTHYSKSILHLHLPLYTLPPSSTLYSTSIFHSILHLHPPNPKSYHTLMNRYTPGVHFHFSCKKRTTYLY